MNQSKQVNDNIYRLYRLKRLKLINDPDIMIKHEIESIKYNRANTIQKILNESKRY